MALAPFDCDVQPRMGASEDAETQAASSTTGMVELTAVGNHPRATYGHVSSDGEGIGGLEFNTTRGKAVICFFWHMGAPHVKAPKVEGGKGERHKYIPVRQPLLDTGEGRSIREPITSHIRDDRDPP